MEDSMDKTKEDLKRRLAKVSKINICKSIKNKNQRRTKTSK